MFSFIHAADIHLDSPLLGLQRYAGADSNEIRNATRRALENLVRLAIERSVDFVVIAGDVYDGDWKDHNTGLFFVSQMSKLREAGIPVIMIAGNHDAANKMTRSLKLSDNVEQLSSRQAVTANCPRLADLGVAVHGRSFAHAAETSNLARDYPSKRSGMFNIGVLHTALEGADGHPRYAPCSLQDLRQKEYDYWALGHVHHRQIISEAPWVVFSGNIQGRHVRETDAKGCYIVSVTDSGQVDLQFEPLDVMRWEVCPIAADSTNHPDEVLGLFHDSLSQLLEKHDGLPLAVRVVVEGTTQCHQALMADSIHWTNQFRSVALQVATGSVWIEKVAMRTRPALELTTEMLGEGPLGELLRYVAELQSDESQLKELKNELGDILRKLPEELLRGPDGLQLETAEQIGRWVDGAACVVTCKFSDRRSR